MEVYILCPACGLCYIERDKDTLCDGCIAEVKTVVELQRQADEDEAQYLRMMSLGLRSQLGEEW